MYQKKGQHTVRRAFKWSKRLFREFLFRNLNQHVNQCALCEIPIEIGDYIRHEASGYVHASCYHDPVRASILREIRKDKSDADQS